MTEESEAARPEGVQPGPVAPPPNPVTNGVNRVWAFIVIQVSFLALSPFTGGFHNKVWSMLDSALLVSSIGITGLLFVLEDGIFRQLAFRAALVLYVCAVIDMSINILLTGWFGWERFGTGAG